MLRCYLPPDSGRKRSSRREAESVYLKSEGLSVPSLSKQKRLFSVHVLAWVRVRVRVRVRA